ncbi:hypothetical protein ABZP36_015785 [Zizania latifolia]
MIAIHAMEAQLGEGLCQFQRFMSKVTNRVRNLETNTLIVAAVVLDPDTYYKFNFSEKPEYALTLTDAIEKMTETPDVAVKVNKKGKRVRVDEEIEFEESEDGDEEDEFENILSGTEDNSDYGFSIDELNDGDDHEQDIEALHRIEQDIKASTIIDPKDCISGRLNKRRETSIASPKEGSKPSPKAC